MTSQNEEWSFVPFPDWNCPIIDFSKAREIQRLDLREVPLESIIFFAGTHNVSNYTCKIVQYDDRRSIKIWPRPDANCMIAPIESIQSYQWNEQTQQLEVISGIMELGKNYGMPYCRFENKDGRKNLLLSGKTPRVELYYLILLQTPKVER